jgi:hypothetical protein
MTFPELGAWISQWKEGKKKERGRELTAISQYMIQHYELRILISASWPRK